MKPIYAVPATAAIVYRAWSHKSLTPAGCVVAALTAAIHAIHPWNLPFVLLLVFFLTGTRVTKIKKDVKEKLTIQATGSAGSEGPRTHIQVLANSGVASILILLSAYQMSQRSESSDTTECYTWRDDLLIVGIIANYAAVAADTFSSELGILSKSQPRLITSLTLRKVPRGTNGGVTIWGLVAGLLGSLIIVTTSIVFLPLCGSPILQFLGVMVDPLNSKLAGSVWTLEQLAYFWSGLVVVGALGSVLDSFLGGWFQESVVDVRSGRVVEGEGGKKVLVSRRGSHAIQTKTRAEIKAKLLSGEGKAAVPKQPQPSDGSPDGQVEEESDANMQRNERYDPKKKMRQPSFGDGEPSRVVENGLGILDNNEVNFLMALTMSLGAMAVAGWAWDIPLSSIIP